MTDELKKFDTDDKDSSNSETPNIQPEGGKKKEERFQYFKKGYFYNRFMGSRSKSKSPSPSYSQSSSSSSRERQDSLPPLSPLNFLGYKNNTKRRLLNEVLANNIRGLLPPRLQLYEDWELVYSTEQHGISLNTLYQNSNLEYQLSKNRNVEYESGYGEGVVNSMMGSSGQFGHKRPQGYIVIIEDDHHSKFGCYLNENLKPMDQKRYYGNGECFLWKCERCYEVHLHDSGEIKSTKKESTRFKAFTYTGVNDNIIYSNHDFIAIGSSNGHNGLWIDKSLYNGVSYACDTFGNEILSDRNSGKIGKFQIICLEVWRVGSLEG